MKLVLQSSMVLLGTVVAAVLVTLGEPAQAELRMAQTAPQADAVLVSLLAPAR